MAGPDALHDLRQLLAVANGENTDSSAVADICVRGKRAADAGPWRQPDVRPAYARLVAWTSLPRERRSRSALTPMSRPR